MEEGHEVLVEQYCEGIDVTVPVLGGENPVILGYVQPKSDKPGSIITEDLKLHDHLGYQLVTSPWNALRQKGKSAASKYGLNVMNRMAGSGFKALRRGMTFPITLLF